MKKMIAILLALCLCLGVTAGAEAAVETAEQAPVIAATVGEHALTDAQLSFYYMASINAFARNYGSYAGMLGLDVSKPLNEQVLDEARGLTWADYFITDGASGAQMVYAVCDAAAAEGFTLSEEQKQMLNESGAQLDQYAAMYGLENADAYVQALYGPGTDKAGLLAYYEMNLLASTYTDAVRSRLTIGEEELREFEARNPAAYSSYSYNQYLLSTELFAAPEDAAAAAQILTDASITTAEALDAAIAALEINAGVEAASENYVNRNASGINATVAPWVTDPARVSGDLTAIPVTAEDSDAVTGYYIVRFTEENRNDANMVNVRHILLSYPSGADEAAKAETLAAGQELLEQWKSGEATEESFAQLAGEKTEDPGSKSTGGLYENIYPGQMVVNFNNWCFDAAREPGDSGIVETEYGVHLMYFSSRSDLTYRDMRIRTDCENEAMDNWASTLMSAAPLTLLDTSTMQRDIVLGR